MESGKDFCPSGDVYKSDDIRKEMQPESASRMNDIASPIHRWDHRHVLNCRSVKRTAESRTPSTQMIFIRPYSRTPFILLILYPAINCWAIFNRPLGGLVHHQSRTSNLSKIIETVSPIIFDAVAVQEFYNSSSNVRYNEDAPHVKRYSLPIR